MTSTAIFASRLAALTFAAMLAATAAGAQTIEPYRGRSLEPQRPRAVAPQRPATPQAVQPYRAQNIQPYQTQPIQPYRAQPVQPYRPGAIAPDQGRAIQADRAGRTIAPVQPGSTPRVLTPADLAAMRENDRKAGRTSDSIRGSSGPARPGALNNCAPNCGMDYGTGRQLPTIYNPNSGNYSPYGN